MGIGHGRGSPYQPPRTCAVLLTPPYMPPPTTLTLFFACRIHPPSPCTRLLALRGLPIPPSIVHSPYTIQRVHTRLLAPPPPHPFPSCSQQIRFGLQTPQEIVKCGVFHVYERALYKVGGTHAPVEHPPTPSLFPSSLVRLLNAPLSSAFWLPHLPLAQPQPLLESEQGPPPFLMCAIHSPTYPFPLCACSLTPYLYVSPLFLPPSPCLCRCRSGRPMRMECWTDAWWGWGECGGGAGEGGGLQRRREREGGRRCRMGGRYGMRGRGCILSALLPCWWAAPLLRLTLPTPPRSPSHPPLPPLPPRV